MRNNNKPKGRKGRKSGGDDTSKKLVIALAAVLAAVVLWLFFNHKSDSSVTGTTGEVSKVIDGNTIQLKSGLKVELLGVKKTESSRSFLEENVKGKTVRLTSDSHESKVTYKDPMTETVRAYVHVEENVSYAALNGHMLRLGVASLNREFCSDSLSVWDGLGRNTETGSGSDPASGTLLSDIELGKKITPATFLIKTDKGLGTGFFINENGLALTNFHMFEGASQFMVYLSDEEGNITSDRNRPLSRPLYADNKLDYAIFVVQLDPGEKVPYLCLADKRPERGTDVGIVGNPMGATATYSKGQISALRVEEGLIQTDANVTHGSSGGPICDHYGRVLGIVRGGMDGSGNLNFGVDIIPVREKLDELKDVKTYGGKK